MAMVEQAEVGVKITELVHKNGVTEATLHNWRARYGVMDASQLHRLKELERVTSGSGACMPSCR
jgi:putative transposase